MRAAGQCRPAVARNQRTNAAELAWLAKLDLVRARANGDLAGAARISEQALPHLVAGFGIEDDFVHLWPPMVLAALDVGDVALAEKLLEPVDSAATGILSPAVAAQLHRMRGLIRSARGDEPTTVESELRAGIAALDAFGAVPHAPEPKKNSRTGSSRSGVPVKRSRSWRMPEHSMRRLERLPGSPPSTRGPPSR